VARLQTARFYLALIIVALYMLLEAAFMLVRVPPGSVAAVPTGEILIFLFALTILLDRGHFGPFLRALPLTAIAIWWSIGFTQLVIGYLSHGFWALRDATSLIESLYLWIGFTVAALPGAIPRIANWFYRILILAGLIALTFPFREIIRDVSPQIMSAVGVATPLFFTYQMTPLTALTCSAFLMLRGRRILGIPSEWWGAALMIFVAVLFQARTIYVQIVVLLAFLALLAPRRVASTLLPMGIAAVLFIGLLALGVPIPGRISTEVSLQFYLDHFLAIFGSSGERTGMENAAIEGAAGGVGQRLKWWEAIWLHVTASWQTALFGLGYGTSLVALAQDPYIDPAVREPHNSIISAFGRTGFIGVAAYVTMHVTLTFTLFRTWLYYRTEGHHEAARFLYLLGAMFVVFWLASVGEDAFEKPFLAIPYYFFYGVILNMFARAEGFQAAGRANFDARRAQPVTAAG
jgi:hypothetical protein